MKIENTQYGKFRLTPETETLEDIAIAVIIASYELAIPFGLGYMRKYNSKMTKEMAKQALDHKYLYVEFSKEKNQ